MALCLEKRSVRRLKDRQRPGGYDHAGPQNPAIEHAAPLLVLWASSPALAWWLSHAAPFGREVLSAGDRDFLLRMARKTWRYFEELVQEDRNGLAPDNLAVSPNESPPLIAPRTSPTNMGLALLADLAAHDFGWLETAGGCTVPVTKGGFVNGDPGFFRPTTVNLNKEIERPRRGLEHRVICSKVVYQARAHDRTRLPVLQRVVEFRVSINTRVIASVP